MRRTPSIKHYLFLPIIFLTLASGPNSVSAIDETQQDTPLTNETENKDSIPLYIISQLKFDGNKHFNQRKLRDLFGWQPKKVYSRNEISEGFESIVKAYKRDGYVFAQVVPLTSPASTNNVSIGIEVKIREGKRLRFGNFSILGNQLFSKSKLLRELGLRKGQFFTQEALETGIERIQMIYSEYGHPKVEIEPNIQNLSPTHGRLDFSLNIREGEKVRISDVKVSGLEKTKQHVVIREIPIKVNEDYDQKKIDGSYHRLRNLGYFHYVNPTLIEEGASEDKVIFHAKVTEGRTGRLIGVLGYAPPVEGSESVPQLTGVVEFGETNLLGTGRDIHFHWKSGLLNALRVGYKEPWILGRPITLGVAYSQLKQRNPFNDAESEERSANLSGFSKFGRFYEGEATLGYKYLNFESITPTLPQQNINPLNVPLHPTDVDRVPATESGSGSKYSITLRLTRDSRDYYINPTRGRRDSFAVELSRSEFRLRKVWLDIQQYFQTWENQIIAIELHGAAAWGVNIPPTELFYLGGASNLRGYDEDWFSGPRRVHANLEYRFIMGRNSQFFTFLDLGSVTFIDRPSAFDRLRIGYGFGARLESKGGIIQLDYGLAAGDSALRGKIHVKLGASF